MQALDEVVIAVLSQMSHVEFLPQNLANYIAVRVFYPFKKGECFWWEKINGHLNEEWIMLFSNTSEVAIK